MTDGTKRIYTHEKGERYSRRRFKAVLSVATAMATVAIITFFSIGMVGASLGVGIGGFVANFGEVNATEGAEIFPVVGQQPACADAPQLQASLKGTANLSGGVEFFKDMPLPTGVFSDDDFARISIKGQDRNGKPIQVSELDLRLSALETDRLSLNGTEITEFGPGDYGDADGPGAQGSYVDTTDDAVGGIDTEGPSAAFDDGRSALDPATGNSSTPEFGIDASGFSIVNGTAAAHFVSFGGISLNDVNIAVQILNKTETGDRTVEPGNRTCDALAEASTVKEPEGIEL